MIPAMLEARIQHQFFETADLINQMADLLARPVAEAAEAVVGCLTAGGKLLVCGQGPDGDLARWFCSALLHRFERERPALPALLLGPGLGQALLATPGLAGEELALQVRTFGQAGDLLVVFAGPPRDDLSLLAALVEAHAADMSVVVLTGGEPGHWPDALAETDVWIPVAHERVARIRELHLLVLHALCDAIDVQLLGEVAPA